MSDFVNKVITIVLIFVMLVLAPLLLSYMSTDMVTERLVLNEVSQFIDKVTDKAMITDQDLNTLYLDVNSHGQAYEVTVSRYQMLEEPEPAPNGADSTSTHMVYVRMDDMDSLVEGKIDQVELNVKDVVQVHIKEITMSTGKRLMWTILRVDKGAFEFSLAGTVR